VQKDILVSSTDLSASLFLLPHKSGINITFIPPLNSFSKRTVYLLLINQLTPLSVWAGRSGSRVRFPVGAGNFSLHHRVQNGSGAHPASYPMRAERLQREADNSPSSSTEVKNARRCISTPPIRLHGVVLC
jgi:hypothetical protein